MQYHYIDNISFNENYQDMITFIYVYVVSLAYDDFHSNTIPMSFHKYFSLINQSFIFQSNSLQIS